MSATAAPAVPVPARAFGVLILAACLIAMLSFGVRASLGLFTDPISDAHGWSREVFALAIALQNLLWGIGQPFAGALADRFGAARTLAAGGLLYLSGIALMAWSPSPAALYITGGLVVGLGLAGASFTIVLAAVARLVEPARRSLALGIVTASGSLGQFLFAPLGQGFISVYGWQTALLLIAAFLVLIPVASPVLRGRSEAGDDPADLLSLPEAVRRASGHGSYWLLVAGFFVCGFHVAFITTHLPPYLTDLGVSGGLAAWSIALIGLFNVIGGFGSGVLGGRYSKRLLLSGLYASRAVAITVFLLLPKTPEVVLAFAAVMGVLWLSTVPLTSGLVAVMFGTRHLGSLFGFVFFSHQVGAFLGVWLGGFLYARTGGYEPVWWLAVGLAVISALLHLPIAERRAPVPAAIG